MATIQIEISTEALEYIYDNVESDSMHVASVNFSNYWINQSLDSVVLDFVGIHLGKPIRSHLN